MLAFLKQSLFPAALKRDVVLRALMLLELFA